MHPPNPRIYVHLRPFARETGLAVVSIDAIRESKNHTIELEADHATVESVAPAAGVPSDSQPESGIHKSQSNAGKQQRVTDLVDGTNPKRDGRNTPKLVPAVRHALEIVDLTLDFSPQLTSTQVAALPPRAHTEGKEKVSSHATFSPRRDRVIKAMPAADGPTFLNDTPLTPDLFVPINVPINVPAELPEPYSSNITTPADTNPSDRATIFPSTSAATSESTGRRSRRDPKPKETKPAKGKKKEKPELVTPLEYARKLQESMQLMAQKPSKRYPKYLKGKRIFYIGGDMQYAGERTRNRMKFVGASSPIMLLSSISDADACERALDRQARRHTASNVRRFRGDSHRD